MKTVKEVGHIYELAKELMGEREKDYEGSWREEGLGCMVGSLYKKASQIRVMNGNGRMWENIERTKEDLLDSVNYSVLCYRLLEREEERCEECLKGSGIPDCPLPKEEALACIRRRDETES